MTGFMRSTRSWILSMLETGTEFYWLLTNLSEQQVNGGIITVILLRIPIPSLGVNSKKPSEITTFLKVLWR